MRSSWLVPATSTRPRSPISALSRSARPALPDLAAASLPDLPLYVHVDFDVLDPAQLPGLRYPVPGGAAATDLAAALSMLLGTGRVAALGLACTWYPGHDAAAAIAAALPAELAGTP
jgi:arginase